MNSIGEAIKYSELLKNNKWLLKRNEIAKRDNYCCQLCGEPGTFQLYDYSGTYLYIPITENYKTASGFFKYHKKTKGNLFALARNLIWKSSQFPNLTRILNVHHKRYIDGKLPWEYNNNDLITVCLECHLDIHLREHPIIYLRNYNGHLLRPFSGDICDRCEGRGILPGYSKIEFGLCYKCYGNKFELINPETKFPINFYRPSVLLTLKDEDLAVNNYPKMKLFVKVSEEYLRNCVKWINYLN